MKLSPLIRYRRLTWMSALPHCGLSCGGCRLHLSCMAVMDDLLEIMIFGIRLRDTDERCSVGYLRSAGTAFGVLARSASTSHFRVGPGTSDGSRPEAQAMSA